MIKGKNHTIPKQDGKNWVIINHEESIPADLGVIYTWSPELLSDSERSAGIIPVDLSEFGNDPYSFYNRAIDSSYFITIPISYDNHELHVIDVADISKRCIGIMALDRGDFNPKWDANSVAEERLSRINAWLRGETFWIALRSSEGQVISYVSGNLLEEVPRVILAEMPSDWDNYSILMSDPDFTEDEKRYIGESLGINMSFNRRAASNKKTADKAPRKATRSTSGARKGSKVSSPSTKAGKSAQNKRKAPAKNTKKTTAKRR